MILKVVASGFAVVVVTVLVISLLYRWQASPINNTPHESVVAIKTERPIGPTARLGSMSVYAVTNPNTTAIEVHHIITDANLFHYEFTSTVPAGRTVEYHVRDMSSIPSPFLGALTLQSSRPFTATVVGYDDPSSRVPTSTPAIR